MGASVFIMKTRSLLHAALVFLASGCLFAQVTALKVGHLVDPETGTSLANQVILIENGKFTSIGPNLSIPSGASVVDLSAYYVSPGLVDAHNHLALTYKANDHLCIAGKGRRRRLQTRGNYFSRPLVLWPLCMRWTA